MQKQQDIGKAHWLSKPTLGGGCHSPLPTLGKCMHEGSGEELIVLKGLPLPLPQVGARQQTPIPTF